jgi:hypothetical protein
VMSNNEEDVRNVVSGRLVSTNMQQILIER